MRKALAFNMSSLSRKTHTGAHPALGRGTYRCILTKSQWLMPSPVWWTTTSVCSRSTIPFAKREDRSHDHSKSQQPSGTSSLCRTKRKSPWLACMGEANEHMWLQYHELWNMTVQDQHPLGIMGAPTRRAFDGFGSKGPKNSNSTAGTCGTDHPRLHQLR